MKIVYGVLVGLDPQPVRLLKPLADLAPRCSLKWGARLRAVVGQR